MPFSEYKHELAFATSLWIFSVLAGLLWYTMFPEHFEVALPADFWATFCNNAGLAIVYGWLGGLTVFLPMYWIFVNALNVARVLVALTSAHGLAGVAKFTALMIHGVPEWAALIIAAAAGLRVAREVVFWFVKRERKTDVKYWLLRGAPLVALAVVLLLIAALLEIYVTPKVLAGL